MRRVWRIRLGLVRPSRHDGCVSDERDSRWLMCSVLCDEGGVVTSCLASSQEDPTMHLAVRTLKGKSLDLSAPVFWLKPSAVI